MASTSISTSAVYYPCPSGVNVANFVPLKLCPTTKLGPSNYSVWRKLMLNLFESHDLEGFVDGTIQPPPSPLEEGKEEEYRSWKRSDGLARGWIFVTVEEDILPILVHFPTAREAWKAFEEMPGLQNPSLPRSLAEAAQNVAKGRRLTGLGPGPALFMIERRYEERAWIASKYLPLYKAILNGDWVTASRFLLQEPDGIRDAITLESETALMVAVRSSERNHIVKNLIEVMSEEEVAWRDDIGKTVLFKALEGGNNEAVKLLVEKYPALPNIADQNGRLAVHWAARLANREMAVYLLEATTVGDDPNPFEGRPGHDLLTALAYNGLYDIASTFLQRYPMLATMDPSPLSKMAQMHSSFRSGTHLNFFESLIYSCIPLTSEGDANSRLGWDIENSAEGASSVSGYLSQRLNAKFWDVVEKLVPTIKSVRETKLIHHQALKFVKDLCEEVVKSENFTKAIDIFQDPMLQAASLGICEIVEEILESFSSGIYLYNDKNQNFLHVAIENRRENVFNLIYQLEETQRHHFMLQLDLSGNNPLHMAGNLGPMQQLSLRASVACPALQMQRELRWFKEVEKSVLPRSKYNRNEDHRTPQEVFTETHKDLVNEGEKWIKDTASSCTIVATLIVTVVFAAAIAVPGGINGDSGLPIFLEDRVFDLFGVFDALALFSSTTSLLMFLSIFTSRYGEQDFFYSLPRKLIIGLVTLFLSIISMMIAFGAILKIVFGHKEAWVVIPIVVLSSVPITLFALLQFPLLLDMIRSTYYPGIFKKRSNRIFF